MVEVTQERLLVDFYASPHFNPQPIRPADTVHAAIGFTLKAAYAPDKVTVEVVEAAAMKAHSGFYANGPIHCNREPSWHELSEDARTQWRDASKAALLAALAVLRGDQIERTDNATK